MQAAATPGQRGVGISPEQLRSKPSQAAPAAVHAVSPPGPEPGCPARKEFPVRPESTNPRGRSPLRRHWHQLAAHGRRNPRMPRTRPRQRDQPAADDLGDQMIRHPAQILKGREALCGNRQGRFSNGSMRACQAQRNRQTNHYPSRRRFAEQPRFRLAVLLGGPGDHFGR